MQKYSYKIILDEKNMENEINKNNEIINEQKREIEYLISKEKKIINDINDLNKELELISNESKKQKSDMEVLIKNFEIINKNNCEDSIKKNIELKKENENLMKIYNQKIKELNEKN